MPVRQVSGAVAPVLEQMRAAAGDRNVWIVGGGVLATQCAREGLIDQLVIAIAPVVLGSGVPILPERLGSALRLTAVRPARNVVLHYDLTGQPVPAWDLLDC